MTEINIINRFSPHLFWDVDLSNINLDKNAKFIVKRILQYGLLSDWKIINDVLGIERITQIAMDIKDLDPKSLSFISTLSHQPKEKFKCYITKPLMPKHWNF